MLIVANIDIALPWKNEMEGGGRWGEVRILRIIRPLDNRAAALNAAVAQERVRDGAAEGRGRGWGQVDHERLVIPTTATATARLG